MREPAPQPNVVSAVRTGRHRTGDPRVRRRIFGTLLLVAVTAIATAALATDRHVREWAAAVAVVGVLVMVIAWLAGKSRSLSSSGREPTDFSGSADSL